MPLMLPQPESIPDLGDAQILGTYELESIITTADDVFVADWQFRAKIADEILERTSGGEWRWERAIPRIICDQTDIASPREIALITEKFRSTALGHFLFLVSGIAISSKTLLNYWSGSLTEGEPSAVIATQTEPEFAKGCFMLGCEVHVNDLVRYLNDAQDGHLYGELEFFIGDSDEKNDPATASDKRKDLEGLINFYQRIEASGIRPIDSERLVGVCKHVMSRLGHVAIN